MNKLQPHINVDYPPNNEIIFEEWFGLVYSGCKTDRELLPVYFTSYWVNNNYGNDKEARRELNDFLGTLDKSKKYFSIIQYDDGSMIDWGLFGLDVLEFNMSKKIGVELPLLCQPHPYSFSSPKKYIASFVGSRTHPIRNELEKFKGKEGWYISFEPHSIQDYCRILHESIFALCPRGYGANSFRITEAMQYNAIPIYISDEFIVPFENDFYYGMRCFPTDDIPLSIDTVPEFHLAKWMSMLPKAYEDFYTYQGCFNEIIKSLETEYNLRQQGGEKGKTDEGDSVPDWAFRF